MAKGMSTKEFLDSAGDARKGGSYLKGWRSNEQGPGKIGLLRFWLHMVTWVAEVWNHAVPKVIEFKDKDDEKVTKVIGERWNCHETDAVLRNRFKRDKAGRLEMPAVVCPQCLLNEYVWQQMKSGAWAISKPLFKWEAEEELVVCTGGLLNYLGSKEVKESVALRKELRKAGISRDEAWNQSMQVKLNYLFVGVDDAQPGEGIVRTFEPKSLGEKMKTAIKQEMRRRKDPSLGDPCLHPYPFEWTYDDSKQFDAKYEVIALTEEKPSDEILKLIGGPAPDLSRDLEPGNCWELRHELESHVLPGVDIPWDKIFGPAEKAGLMHPPEETKADAEDDEDDASEVGASKGDSDVFVVGPDHDIWFDEKADLSAVRGKAVVLEEAEGEDAPTEKVIEEVVAALKKAGATSVGHVVACDNCGKRMTTYDPHCPTCGAGYDDDGKVDSMRCLKDAKHRVEVSGGPGPYICGTCAAIHVGPLKEWRLKPEETTQPSGGEKRRRRADAAEPPKAEEKPQQRARRGVAFDKAAT